MARTLALSTSEKPVRKRLTPEQRASRDAEYARFLEQQTARELDRNPSMVGPRKVRKKGPAKKRPAKKAKAPVRKRKSPPTSMRAKYNQYMTSPAWGKKRMEYFNSDMPQGCQGCGVNKPGLHLHHRTYERLGRELLTDLVPVCKQCHDRIHRNFNMFLFDLSHRTDVVLAAIRRSKETGKPYRNPTSKKPISTPRKAA